MNDKVSISMEVTKKTADILRREADSRNMGFGECAGEIIDSFVAEKTQTH